MSLERGITIENLPEDILLEILGYLPVKDRCLAGRVCRQWHRIASDSSLWRHVDLLEYRLDLTKMWKVLRARLSSVLLTVKIRGYAHAIGAKRRKVSVSEPMLKELAVRCPNLWLLHLSDCNTNNIPFESLPVSIRSLHITYSSWQPRWLKDKQHHLPHLETLDLSCSVRVDSFDLEDIAKWTSLRTLSLSGCYRVKDAGIEVIAKNLKELRSLNLSSSGIDALAIHHIARHLKDLRELYLAGCPGVDDSGLATLGAGLPRLDVLDISHCDSVTLKGLESLFVTKLRVLTVVKTSRLTEETIAALQNGFRHPVLLTA